MKKLKEIIGLLSYAKIIFATITTALFFIFFYKENLDYVSFCVAAVLMSIFTQYLILMIIDFAKNINYLSPLAQITGPFFIIMVVALGFGFITVVSTFSIQEAIHIENHPAVLYSELMSAAIVIVLTIIMAVVNGMRKMNKTVKQ